MGLGAKIREQIAKRAAREVKNGMLVNLGIGIPTLVGDYIPDEIKVMFHAENGIVGTGPAPESGLEDPNLCNAGGLPTTILPGASYLDSSIAFAIIRRGLLDLTIMGALQVSQSGDLANWIVPGKRVPGMGGAMELAQKAKRVVIVMTHVDSSGRPKILSECTLPLTAKGAVDLIITDRAVIEVKDQELVLKEVFKPHTVQEVIKLTGAELIVDPSLSLLEL